ncbi:hypothetical protein [Aeromicrobium sp. UC242_57]|uniref:hypothetical protein n=1 Tax=Aeromicrobium sp. UC242_57 TaxID=3374624 RepID=UPI0037A9155D
MASKRRRPWYRRHMRRRLSYALAGLAALAVIAFAWQSWQASQSLRLAANQADLLQTQIVAGDSSGARRTLDGLRQSADTARRRTDGPMWDIGSKVPLLGRNIGAVQRVSEVVDEIAKQALPPVVALSEQINLRTFSPQDGRVDVGAIARTSATVRAVEGGSDAQSSGSTTSTRARCSSRCAGPWERSRARSRRPRTLPPTRPWPRGCCPRCWVPRGSGPIS